MNVDYKLTSKDSLTELVRCNGIESWNELTAFVKNLPYGRTSNRTDFGLVLSESKGSCSSKHALLKKIADLNNIPDVKLMLGIYKMNELNTPNIGTVLADNSIKYIPEAHCYLKLNDKYLDVTTMNSKFSRIEMDILKVIEIEPDQVINFKVEYHKEFIRNWLKSDNLLFNFEQIWHVRECCIENLSK